MSEYHKRFFTNLKKSYENQQDFYPDITLHCIEDDSKLPCHRIILATSSEYFKNVFSWSSGEVIEVHNNISGETLGIILKYIYSGEITLTLENASDILSAANYFNLLEIVEDCVTFLLDNIEISTCIDLLQLAYQLDLSKLLDGTLSFVANNFSNILDNSEYKTNLLSIPTKLMIDLLKSGEIVTRNKETGLCTRPIEREKHLIDFIISYCEDQSDKSIISSLLPSIKWPLLKIFGEEKYVFEKLTPKLNEKTGKKELEDLLDVKFTEWFSSSDTSDPTADDKSLYSTRAFSCSELVPTSPMASGNQVSSEPGTLSEPFSCIADENECLEKVSIVLRRWDGHSVVGGIGLSFSFKGKNIEKHVGMKREKGTSVNNIILDKDEHIIEVHGNSGWLVDKLVFKTSKNKTHGPYGGDGGSEKELMSKLSKYRIEGGYGDPNGYQWYKSVFCGPHKRLPLDSFLVGITGKVLTTQEDLAITHLSFIFRAMLPSSNFLISDKKTCEVSITDAKKSVRDDGPDIWSFIHSDGDESDYLEGDSDDPDFDDPDIYDPEDLYGYGYNSPYDNPYDTPYDPYDF